MSGLINDSRSNKVIFCSFLFRTAAIIEYNMCRVALNEIDVVRFNVTMYPSTITCAPNDFRTLNYHSWRHQSIHRVKGSTDVPRRMIMRALKSPKIWSSLQTGIFKALITFRSVNMFRSTIATPFASPLNIFVTHNSLVLQLYSIQKKTFHSSYLCLRSKSTVFPNWHYNSIKIYKKNVISLNHMRKSTGYY